MPRSHSMRRPKAQVVAMGGPWRAAAAAMLSRYGWRVVASDKLRRAPKGVRVLIIRHSSLAASADEAARAANRCDEDGAAVLVFTPRTRGVGRPAATPPTLLAHLSTATSGPRESSNGFAAGPFKLDVALGRAWVKEHEIALTRAELAVFALLLYRAPEPVSLEEMQEALTGVRERVATSRMRMLVSKLRRKLGDERDRVQAIVPRRYRLVIFRRSRAIDAAARGELRARNPKSLKKAKTKTLRKVTEKVTSSDAKKSDR